MEKLAGDQFSFSLIYLSPSYPTMHFRWGSILVFPDILVNDDEPVLLELGINSRFP